MFGISEKHDFSPDYPCIVRSFYFYCGGFDQGHDYMIVKKNNGRIMAAVTPSIERSLPLKAKEIPYDEWNSINIISINGEKIIQMHIFMTVNNGKRAWNSTTAKS